MGERVCSEFIRLEACKSVSRYHHIGQVEDNDIELFVCVV